MTDLAVAVPRQRRRPAHRGIGRGIGRRILGFALILAALGLACGPVAYMLWPQRKAGPPDAPSLPITVGGVAFNVPPAAIRFKMQRRAGAQVRVDLAFLWPSLEPPGPVETVSLADAPKLTERIFVSLAGSSNTLPPDERFKVIYPRYLVGGPAVDMAGLAVRAFRGGTPYQGEDLIYDPAAPERFLMRCTQSFGAAPGTCLVERRHGSADITLRFPREWLADWRAVASGIERLIGRLRAGGS